MNKDKIFINLYHNMKTNKYLVKVKEFKNGKCTREHNYFKDYNKALDLYNKLCEKFNLPNKKIKESE